MSADRIFIIHQENWQPLIAKIRSHISRLPGLWNGRCLNRGGRLGLDKVLQGAVNKAANHPG